MGEGQNNKLESITKGRRPSRLLIDLLKLGEVSGARGVAYRASYELTRMLGPQYVEPAPPPPPPPAKKSHTHAFEVARSKFYSPTSEELTANQHLVEQFASRPTQISSATWFVPWFNHVLYGGINTILRFISWLRTERGVEPRIVMYDHPDLEDSVIRSLVTSGFPDLIDIDIVAPPKGRAPFVDFAELPATDVGICTIWYSAYALLRFNNTKAKFYFVQDFEPAFYPAGTVWAQAEATYRFGFAGLVNTPGLGEIYQSYGNPAHAFIPAVDDIAAKRPQHSDSGPVQIVLYGRPGTDRNGFELLASACCLVKSVYGDKVRIVSAGEDFDPDDYELEGIMECAGLLGDRRAIDQLYLASDIGLCCMFSSHPSYQPLEYMAAGVAVVTNVNPDTSWLLSHEENCLLTEPFSTALAEAIGRLVEDSALRARLAEAGRSTISSSDWNSEFAGMWSFMTNTK